MSSTPAHAESTQSPPEVAVEGVWKAFGEREVLKGVNLSISRGELVAIVGSSGSGKTVLLKHITGHFQPDRGVVRVADHERQGSPLQDLAELSPEEMDEIRVHWAVVFQRNALMTGTVYENLALWLKEIKRMDEEQIRPLAVKALKDVGLDPVEVMQRDRDALSGGMAKRVAVARALVMDPVLILYDEPTSGLDPEMSGHIHDLILQTHDERPGLGVERTSVVVTHDTELLRRLRPRVVMLHDGKVFFDGTFAEFSAADAAPIRPYIEQMPTLHGRVRQD